MKNLLLLVFIITLCSLSPAYSFDEQEFTDKLLSFNQVAIPVAAAASYQQTGKTQKGGGNDFHWLTADKINAQLERIIQGIEGAKGVATALAVIVNLYNSDQISAEVALTAVQILKVRAMFVRVFVSNGDAEIEIMINILNEHEEEFGKKKAANSNTKVEFGANGKIQDQGFIIE